MHTKTRKVGKVLVVTVEHDRLDSRIADDFKTSVVKEINSGETEIVLNLSSVDFIDSTGLGALVSTKNAVGANGEVVISGAGTTVMTMFRLTRTDTLFRIVPTDEEAVSILQHDEV